MTFDRGAYIYRKITRKEKSDLIIMKIIYLVNSLNINYIMIKIHIRNNNKKD